MTAENPPFQKSVLGSILAFLMVSNFGVTVFILEKKIADLKPMNRFQSNYLAGFGFISITAMYVVVYSFRTALQMFETFVRRNS